MPDGGGGMDPGGAGGRRGGAGWSWVGRRESVGLLVCLSVGRSVDRSTGRSVGRSDGRSVGHITANARHSHPLCVKQVVLGRAARWIEVLNKANMQNHKLEVRYKT